MLISYVACDAAKLLTFYPGDGAGVNTFDLLLFSFVDSYTVLVQMFNEPES